MFSNNENDCNLLNTLSQENPRLKKKFTVCVEGNIGSGKSTFLHYFTNSEKVEVLFEPVEKWKDLSGWNTLDLMYKDSTRWSLTFQSYVQLTMLMNHTRKQVLPLRLIERSIYSAQYCFIENLHNQKFLPDVDYAVLSEWFSFSAMNLDVNVDLIVYLQASPESCLERLKKRNREEEVNVSIEYLRQLHELHEDWLIRKTSFQLPAPVLVLDAGKSLPELQKEIEHRRKDITCGVY